MIEWLAAIEGTETGHDVALALALLAAFLHAVFGALQKGRYDPWLMRGAIDFNYLLIALPVALFLVPRPTPFVWALLGRICHSYALQVSSGTGLFQRGLHRRLSCGAGHGAALYRFWRMAAF